VSLDIKELIGRAFEAAISASQKLKDIVWSWEQPKPACDHNWVPDEYETGEAAPDVCTNCLKSRDEVES
jgi:hypothetical protein